MKRTGYVMAASILVAGILAGCGGNVETSEDAEKSSGIPAGDFNEAKIVEVSGVRCVVISSYRTAAIDCDWEGTR